MRDANIKKLVLAALMAALTYVATSIVQIPSPMQGYVNLGDCIVLLSGWILGPWWGAAAGGIGSMLVDLIGGYGHYAPGTLVIKGCMAQGHEGEQGLLRHQRCGQRGHHGGGLLRLRLPAAGQGLGRCGQYPRQSGAGCYGHGHRPGAAGGTQAQ